jgi:GAF domain-containing protein
MAELAAAVDIPSTLEQTLLVLTRGAVGAVPGAMHASITTRRPDGTLETAAATDPLVDKLDARQYDLREGPCYAAATTETIMVSYDLAHDPRWPNYGPAASEAGVHAQLGVLLTDNGKGRSALNLYAARPHEFDADAIETAELFASHAAVAMGFVHTVSSLSRAVATRQAVGMAVGVLMERYQLDSERAFAFLTRTSQDSNVKLRDVAAQIVAGHDGRTRSTGRADRRATTR